jgi:hypothetical protein
MSAFLRPIPSRAFLLIGVDEKSVYFEVMEKIPSQLSDGGFIRNSEHRPM